MIQRPSRKQRTHQQPSYCSTFLTPEVSLGSSVQTPHNRESDLRIERAKGLTQRDCMSALALDK